jgi:rhamnosyl/mannosyltransferase
MYQPLLSGFVRRAEAVVAATPYHFSGSTQMPQELRVAQKVVIPYCLETQHLVDSMNSRQRKTELLAERAAAGGRAIFALGRHVYYKGFDVLIRAMHAIDALLWLGGSGPLTEELKTLVHKEGLQSRVRFVGRVPDEELIAYYEAGDVFVLPSVEKSEAFGLVQLEAMYCRRPVVSCRLGTGVDWVNQDGVTGIVVAPRDEESLAAAVNRLLADASLRSAMGEAGRQRVDREFSMDTMVRRMITLYRDVCGEPAAARAAA